MIAVALHAPAADAAGYLQQNLYSDGAVPAAFMDKPGDKLLVNPWGISHSPTGPFWISDNGTGITTLHNGTGALETFFTVQPPVVGGTASPTGQVFNGAGGFNVTENNVSGSSFFIFGTEDGTINGWNPTVDKTALIAVDNSDGGASTGAVYKGVALAEFAGHTYLYATNFRSGKIDVFDENFQPVPRFGFGDFTLPQGYAPFNIANIAGELYVSYALQDAAKHDDVAGPGHGFIDVFKPNGTLVGRFASRGVLNSPWGMVVAPGDFGELSGKLLVGNFGDGKINAFDLPTHAHVAVLSGADKKPIVISGLWGLIFGNGGSGGDLHTLYFTAGLNDENDGLFGSLSPVK